MARSMDCRDSLASEPLPLYSETLDLAVLWNAKAGSTFATKWLLFQEGLLDEAEAYASWVHQYRQQVYCRRPGYRDKLARIPDLGQRVVKFVRNPFDRSVSSYLSFCQQASHLSSPQHTPVLRSIGRHLGRAVGEGELFTFREFVSWLGSLDLDAANIHVRRQSGACEQSGLLADMHLVRIENARDVLPRLEEGLGLSSSSPLRLQRSRHHTSRVPAQGFVGDRPFGDVRRDPVPTVESFFDSSLEAEIRDLYHEDMQKYGYVGPGRLTGPDLERAAAVGRADPGPRSSQHTTRSAAADSSRDEGIPKSVLQFWHEPEAPQDVQQLMDTWREMPGYDYKRFDDEGALRFIRAHYPHEHVSAFASLRLPAARSDLFRVAYLAVNGGIYVDAGIAARTSLDDWLHPDDTTVLVQRGNGIVINGFLACHPGSAVFRRLVDQVTKNVHARSSDNVWALTGPGVLKRILEDSDEEVRIVEWSRFLTYCRPTQALQHKSGHWSKRQRDESLFHT